MTVGRNKQPEAMPELHSLAQMDQRLPGRLPAGVVVENELAIVGGIIDQADRRAIALAEEVMADIDLPGLRLRVNQPDPHMVTRRLRVGVRLTRRGFPLHAEAAAAVDARVVFEPDARTSAERNMRTQQFVARWWPVVLRAT
jgi:hypothetical protein